MKRRYLGVLLTIMCLPLVAQGAIGPEPSAGAPGDYIAPSLPTLVQLVSDGTKVIITWTDPKESDFHFVEILRNDGVGTQVTGDIRVRIGKGIQRYEDTDVRAGETYHYQLRVADTSLNKRLSDEYEVVVQPPRPALSSAPAPVAPVAPAASPAPAVPTTLLVSITPSVGGAGETLHPGTFAYGAGRLQTLAIEQALAKMLAQGLDEHLPGVFNRLFHQHTATSKGWWYGYVNAYIYGGYTLKEIVQSVRFGGKTVHPAIAAPLWRNSADYQAYINR